MVKTRVKESLQDFREHSVEIITFFGRTITLVSITETLNAMGRVNGRTETPTTFTGDVQYLDEQDKEFLGEGVNTQGMAKLFTTYDVTITENNELDIDGVRWKLVKKKDSPDIGGGRDFQEWIIKRKP